MAHRTIRLTDEDEKNIALVQEHFRTGPVPINVHWNDVIRTGLKELVKRLEGAAEAGNELDSGNDPS